MKRKSKPSTKGVEWSLASSCPEIFPTIVCALWNWRKNSVVQRVHPQFFKTSTFYKVINLHKRCFCSRFSLANSWRFIIKDTAAQPWKLKGFLVLFSSTICSLPINSIEFQSSVLFSPNDNSPNINFRMAGSRGNSDFIFGILRWHRVHVT